MLLGIEDKLLVTKKIFSLMQISSTRGRKERFDWSAWICDTMHRELIELKMVIKKDHLIFPKFSYYSILIHFLLGQLSKETLYMLGAIQANCI